MKRGFMSRIFRDDFIVFGAPLIEEAEINEVVDSLRSGWIGTGPKVARFEDMFGDYIGSEHAVAVNSCTAGLHLAMLAAGLGPGDEVITTAMTFVATVNAIIHCGATPVLVDCYRDTGLIDPQRVEDAITPKTRAIVPVHLYGRPCDMDAIMDIARRHDLVVIEDASHAIEAVYKGKKVGTIGDLTCFSFYVTKNITTGEGGMVTTNNAEYADRIKILALHGMSKDAWKRFSDEGYKHYQVVFPGFKYNMMDIQAAIGIHQLKRIDSWHLRRNEIWQTYNESFKDLSLGLPIPDSQDIIHAHHLYTLLVDKEICGLSRDEFMQRLYELNVGTGVHYIGVHLHNIYQKICNLEISGYQNATWISDRTVSIPLSPKLTKKNEERIIESVLSSLNGGRID
jgi:dTDP-4-amino-4,6-dideoxygalactose transaminase